MKKTFYVLLVIITSNLAFANSKIPIKVDKIYDGDTISAKIDKEEFSIRLIGIDCYETSVINRTYKQAYENNLKLDEVISKGNESKKYLEKLYEDNKNKNIFFDFKGVDKYGRALGIIYFDKMNINEQLSKNGGCLKYIYKN